MISLSAPAFAAPQANSLSHAGRVIVQECEGSEAQMQGSGIHFLRLRLFECGPGVVQSVQSEISRKEVCITDVGAWFELDSIACCREAFVEFAELSVDFT